MRSQSTNLLQVASNLSLLASACVTARICSVFCGANTASQGVGLVQEYIGMVEPSSAQLSKTDNTVSHTWFADQRSGRGCNCWSETPSMVLARIQYSPTRSDGCTLRLLTRSNSRCDRAATCRRQTLDSSPVCALPTLKTQ